MFPPPEAHSATSVSRRETYLSIVEQRSWSTLGFPGRLSSMTVPRGYNASQRNKQTRYCQSFDWNRTLACLAVSRTELLLLSFFAMYHEKSKVSKYIQAKYSNYTDYDYTIMDYTMVVFNEWNKPPRFHICNRYKIIMWTAWW